MPLPMISKEEIDKLSCQAIDVACVNTENILLNPMVLLQKGCYKIERMKGTKKDLIVVTNIFRYNAIFFALDTLCETELAKLHRIFNFLFPSEKVVNDAAYFELLRKYISKLFMNTNREK